MENKKLDELIERYKLTKKEHSIILESLKKDLFDNMITEKSPSIMFVVGQPGCGKTTFIESTDLSKYVIVNSDYYRVFNKYSKEILDKYPTDYAKLTNFDVHLWGDELFSYALQNGYSVLREKAPIDYSLLEIIKTVPHDYEVIVNVVVRGNLSSLLATRKRYEKEIVDNKNAKLSNIEAHNKCYALLPDFILKCISLGAKVNYIVSTDNEFKIIPVDIDNYADLLEKFRDDSNKKACLNYDVIMNNINMSMINRSAGEEQFNELTKINNIYSEIINSNTSYKTYKK